MKFKRLVRAAPDNDGGMMYEVVRRFFKSLKLWLQAGVGGAYYPNASEHKQLSPDLN